MPALWIAATSCGETLTHDHLTLTREEMVQMLEEIAREGNNAAARIAAIKALMEIAPREPDDRIWAS